MADILTSQSYQDEIYTPHLTQQQSQTNIMQYTSSFQQHGMFGQQPQQQPHLPQMNSGGSHNWFDTDL